MTDRKRDDDFADLTAPVPVRVQDSKPSTDEADAETFIGEVSRRPVTGDDDTVQRSFDDDIAKQKVPARPARTERPAKPAPVDVDFPAAGDTNQFMQAVFANAGEALPGRSTRPDRVATKKVLQPVALSAEDRAEPDEPTVAKAPDLNPDENTEAAPVANPDDAESIPTAPIPMMSGLTREMLRDDEPSLPRMRPPPEVGDGIEREPSAPATTPEPPVDHTPLYRPVATSTELVGRAEQDERDITSPDLEVPAKSRAPLFIIGTVAGLALAALVIVVAVILSHKTGSDSSSAQPKGATVAPVTGSATTPSATSPPSATATTPSATATTPSATATTASAIATTGGDATLPSGSLDAKEAARAPESSAATKASATATKESDATLPSGSIDAKQGARAPESSAATKASATATKESAASSPASASTAKEAESAPKSSASSTAAPPARRADGFGPFVDHSGFGLGGSLDAAARSIVGSLEGTDVGVRGEILRVDTSKKDKTTSVECAFTVFDKTGGRARMGATSKGAKPSEAAQSCAQSLAPDLQAAVARVKGP